MPITIDSFKAYDIRGQIPNQLNSDICYRIGNATGAYLKADSIVVGRDMRLTSEEFADAVIDAISDAAFSRLVADQDLDAGFRPGELDVGVADSRIGIFDVRAYVSKWRVAVLVICVLAMFLTPADPCT